ncbi:hypothetical protein [Paraburkholderia tropica]|uniref:hypothetical protein n=1 Tax=Paraburkholderia tropica TaxID=92647 RepID=UPI002AB77733|nr:hypothetical protein [Paraburkholderia tropica]
MVERTLHEVLADVIDAGHRYPAMQDVILHCLFDEFAQLRDGLFRIEASAAAAEADASGALHLTALVTKLWPTDWLLQLAHAVSRGVMPEMVLPATVETDRHESLRARDEHEATVSGDSFMRIPEYLNGG